MNAMHGGNLIYIYLYSAEVVKHRNFIKYIMEEKINNNIQLCVQD